MLNVPPVPLSSLPDGIPSSTAHAAAADEPCCCLVVQDAPDELRPAKLATALSLVSNSLDESSTHEPFLAAAFVASGLLREAVQACKLPSAGQGKLVSDGDVRVCGLWRLPVCPPATCRLERRSACPYRALQPDECMSVTDSALVAFSVATADHLLASGAAARAEAEVAAALEGLATELAAAVQCCRVVIDRVYGLDCEERPSVEQVEQLMLPAAEAAAAALHRRWALPCYVAAEWHELARAAAARSCANLRFPNVSLEGGPDAGEGVGCKRCGGCGAVW